VLKTANYPVADAANVEAEASARKERDAGRARIEIRWMEWNKQWKA
jgi:hypothetical protein